jgi:hypothetical protein
MKFKLLFTGLCLLAATFWFNLASPLTATADDRVPSVASGTGIFCPATGYFFGSGDGTPLGKSYYNGVLELAPTGQLTFDFQNKGRGTENEILQESYAEDGSVLYFRFGGTVTLMPIDNLGNFRAMWTGIWEIVKGTGRMRNAKGNLQVTAVNDPFNINDPKWTFDWSWSGEIKVKKNATKHYADLQTGGFGVFDPANIGVGDPNTLPFPIIIGDGSGLGVYDGTPTGFEFKLDGQLVGDGFDQHFGTAQSLSPGIPAYGRIFYPGVSGPNPDGSGRILHVMTTRDGQIWYHNRYYFELDPVAQILYGRCNFEIVGGTERFDKASGTVMCQVQTNLADVFVDPQGDVNAPFRYDFNGYIDIKGR